ncbi:hypothetical protein Tco_1349297 [Tanacetum coccineum]
MALLSSSASASKAATVMNKGLIAEAYEWDEEEVSSDDNEMVEVKVLMELAEENDAVTKEGARNGEWVKISMRKKRILGADQLTEDPSSSRQTGLVFVNSSADDTKVSIPGVERPWFSEAEFDVTDSSATDYDSTNESSVCSTPLPPLKKLDGVIINESSPPLAKDNKSSPASKVNSAPADLHQDLKSQDHQNASFYPTYTMDVSIIYPMSVYTIPYVDYAEVMTRFSLEREINPRNTQHALKRCEACGSSTHTTTDHYDIEWFKRGEALQAKKVEVLKSTRAESSNANRSKTPTRSGCLRHLTGVKSYLHKYVEQLGPKVVFGDDSTCTTEGYGSIKCNGIFDEKRGTIFNSNKEVVMIALRDKPCSSCEKGKHHRANFKTKQTSSIKKCLHLLHMDLFGHVTPRSINHEKYAIVIADEYSRYPPNEYLHPYEPSQRYQTNSNDVSFIKPYKSPEPVILKTKVSSDPNGQTAQTDEIFNDNLSEHSNHNNDEQIIDNHPNTEDIQISEHLSSLNVEDASI